MRKTVQEILSFLMSGVTVSPPGIGFPDLLLPVVDHAPNFMSDLTLFWEYVKSMGSSLIVGSAYHNTVRGTVRRRARLRTEFATNSAVSWLRDGLTPAWDTGF